MKRRKTVSVIPAIGASTVAGAICTPPIFKLRGNPHLTRRRMDQRIVIKLLHTSIVAALRLKTENTLHTQ